MQEFEGLAISWTKNVEVQNREVFFFKMEVSEFQSQSAEVEIRK
jgi:hypothetical protein